MFLASSGVWGVLIEEYVKQMVSRYGSAHSADFCTRVAGELLESTSHLVKVSSIARGAGVCVFIARLIELMGVRGLYHSVLPGKGAVVHQLLAVAFPRILRDTVAGGLSRNEVPKIARSLVEEVYRLLENMDALYTDNQNVIEEAKNDAVIMAVNGVEFVTRFACRFGVNLEKASVYTELPLMSYRLHMWGVADVVIEDSESRSALIIEWKSYRGSNERTPRISIEDVLQAYGYALLEADRLGYDDVLQPVLDNRIGIAVVRPVSSGRAIPYYVVYPREACTASSCWSRDELREQIEFMMLLAEHLTLVLASKKKAANRLQMRWDTIETMCSIRTWSGATRPVFNRIPEHPLLRKRMSNPKRRDSSWPCNACPYRDACEYYVFSSTDPEFIDVRRLAWRTRYAIMEIRENALQPYREIRDLVISHGGYDWVRGHVKTRILSDGNRVDFFDEANVEEDGVVLHRRPTRFEDSEDIIITLREGKPAVVYFNESHVADPLLRLGFYGIVTDAKYDETIDRIIVRLEPASPPSRIYIPLLLDLQQRSPELFRNVLAFEVNVELTHLELLAVDAFERGTYKALEEFEQETLEEAEKTLALILGGLDWNSFINQR